MNSTTLSRGAFLTAVTTVALTLSACGSDSDSASGSASSPAPSSSTAARSSSPVDDSQPFGAGCAQVPADGPGSFQGMSTAPVASAASANPVLSTLVQAVGAAGLVDSLNSQEDVTVLAPANPAFEALPPDQLNAVLADVPQLTAVLTHHVLQGRLSPGELAGEQTTLNNDAVTIEGAGENFTISGDQTLTGQPATVVCGNVQTANATVYIIDQVLAPRSAG
ncbi:fasciclin domain-containing protein [Geodermatophilus sp. URMC 64]